MKLKKETWGTLGLFMITVWSALQYIFLQNIPDTVPTFAFMCITNIVGLLVLGCTQIKKLKLITKKTLLKGLLLTSELIGFNFFLIVGSRGVDPVVISSMLSMYFVFVMPLLLIMKKKISFRSAIAAIIAILALLLIFNANIEMFFTSKNIFYLILSDIFFAAYIVTIPYAGKGEDDSLLAISQLFSSAIFAFIGWLIEAKIAKVSVSLPTDGKFWVSVLFLGIFIRALYGLMQIKCQKYVKPINASLIFASEIIITLITNPIMSKIMGTTYDKATGYQIIGCILFVVAMLIADDGVMAKIGYNDMEAKVYIDEDGNEKVQTSVSKKLINMTFIISIPALIVATVVCITSISGVKKTAVDKSTDLGNRAATSSAEALKSELEKELVITASDKASLAKEKLDSYISSAKHASDYAKELYSSPNSYAAKEVKFPIQENVGKWAMQRLIANESIPYNSIKRENGLLGNIEPLFRSIVENSDNVATIYLGTESGFLISYDPNSGDAELGTENYYEFRLSDWYKSGKLAKEPFFTAAYQDSYGRGLTITCVSPIYTENGVFKGCIGIDVLINDINRLMVNDGIEEPNYAALIGPDGEIIASRDFDGFSDEQHNIYDRDINLPLKELPNSELFSDENGVSVIGEGNDATYIAHSKVSLTNWTLCIMSPVSQIIKPALEIKDNIESNTEAVAGAVNNSISVIIENCLVMFAIIILAITFFVGKLADRITLPLRHLEKDVQEISEGNFGKKTTVSTDDEIGSLARAFSSMSVSLKKYIVDLKDATAKEERIASELSVATRIQADMLPSDFSAFENNKEFDVYASMDPAKEVGGDFYDIFMIDDTHLALVMADVSGKGVPAALFMTVSKLLLNSQTNVSTEPADILAAVNDKLCENNKEGMFVTVWMGIMDLTTGVVKAANAGHEFPAISKKGEKFELLHDKHGMVLAGIEHSRYKQYEFTLEPGDRLFLYTDGVPEATNAENQLFGTDRMVEWLNKEEGISPAEVLKKVREGVDNFVDKAPQFDDITMLCLEYKEKSKANGDKKSEVENG